MCLGLWGCLAPPAAASLAPGLREGLAAGLWGGVVVALVVALVVAWWLLGGGLGSGLVVAVVVAVVVAWWWLSCGCGGGLVVAMVVAMVVAWWWPEAAPGAVQPGTTWPCRVQLLQLLLQLHVAKRDNQWHVPVSPRSLLRMRMGALRFRSPPVALGTSRPSHPSLPPAFDVQQLQTGWQDEQPTRRCA